MIAFIFDIDGTIIDSMPAHGRSWQIFLARRGMPYGGDAFLRSTAGRTAAEIMRVLFATDDEARVASLVREKEHCYRELFASEFREVDGFRAFARRASADGIAIACATAGDADNIAFALAGLGMEDEFDALAGGHEVRQGKPSPELFLLAASRLGAEPTDCVVFEDSPLGIEGARRAGMCAVGVMTSESDARLAGPHVLATVRDYRALLPARIVDAMRAHRGSERPAAASMPDRA